MPHGFSLNDKGEVIACAHYGGRFPVPMAKAGDIGKCQMVAVKMSSLDGKLYECHILGRECPPVKYLRQYEHKQRIERVKKLSGRSSRSRGTVGPQKPTSSSFLRRKPKE